MLSLLVTCVVLLIIISVAKRQSHVIKIEKATETTIGTIKGLSFSPKGTGGNDITDFFSKASQLGGAVTWAGDWQELSTGSSLIIKQAKKYDLVPIAIVTAFKDSGQSKVAALRPLTSSQIEIYTNLARDFAAANKPAYFGVGIEVNRIYESSPSGYRQFLELFNKTVTAVHSSSPDTKVFTTFQLERLKGLRGGLFGGVNNEAINNWELLDDFSTADALAFTSYPSIIFHSPGDIPADYYQSIATHTKKAILFSELGWPAGSVATGWNSSAALQSQFVDTYFDRIKGLSPRVIIWSFLYDPKSAVPFNTMGFFSADGIERSAWQKFLKN